MTIYNKIGQGYSNTRKSDSRIVSAMLDILQSESISTIADIGAGTGSYAYALANKRDYKIIAVEPSETMCNQATVHPNIKWINANAESLPLSNSSVDAAIIILAMHHFKDYRRALQEAFRITGNGLILIFTYDPALIDNFWLTNYFPTLANDARATFIPLDLLVSNLQDITQKEIKVTPFPLPCDLVDSFAAVGWAKPELYLDAKIRQGISAFHKINSAETNRGLTRLKDDLKSGIWQDKYGYLQGWHSYDVGYRIIHTAT